ncbi:MAG: diaminopimelate decarboxylase [Acidimicrobiales bacterium]|nr:diaminopimelate decarboxylase [Acidimicrobiales bacterium]
MAGPIPQRLLPDTATIAADGHLHIGGVDTVELAELYGTPLFVYDEQHLRNRCRAAVDAFPGGAYYATKAFLCGAMARLAHREGMRLDVASGGELALALRSGVPAADLLFHGNNKSTAELREALDAGVGRIVIDSFDELDRLDRLVHGEGRPKPRVLIRVTPGVKAHTHEYVSTGQEDSKFGFGLRSGAADAAIERLRGTGSPATLIGLHMHIGSQVFVAQNFARAMEAIAEFVKRADLPEMNIGGGLGVAYVEREESEPISAWGERVHASCRALGLSATISAEPGRVIAAQAAVTLYRAGTIKDIAGVRTYVAVDGGMIDNPRPAMYGSEYEAFLPRAASAERPRRVRVVGKHCESGDILLHDAALPEDLCVDDIIATPVTGAYGFAMGSNYNRLGRPAVVFVADGHHRLVVRRETIEDLLATDLELD